MPTQNLTVVVARWGDDYSASSSQLRQSIEKLNSLLGPVILLANLNSATGASTVLMMLNQVGMRDAFADAHNETYPFTQNGKDYVLYKNLKVLESFVLEPSLVSSTHSALVAVFTLDRNATASL
jgi:endonuclease/exonuclease/phosphatase (EEP) superfamily protein YafD